MAAEANRETQSASIFLEALEKNIKKWESEGVPPRWTLIKELNELAQLRKSLGVSLTPFRLVTATLDDGWGLGLEIIHNACNVLGISYTFMGLLKTPEEIAQLCESEKPDAVGVTVIQEETLDTLFRLRSLLSPKIKIFAGGPAIKEFISHEGIQVFKNVLEFIILMKKGVKGQ